MSRQVKKTGLVYWLKQAGRKFLSLLAIILVLSFVGYHFYSISHLFRHFKQTTGLSAAESHSK